MSKSLFVNNDFELILVWFVFFWYNDDVRRMSAKGLGFSSTSQYYAIRNKEEAKNYLRHPILSKRLMEISEELLKLESNNVSEIFGYPDDMKLKSSMTLFYLISGQEVFQRVLGKFFAGELDERTVNILNEM